MNLEKITEGLIVRNYKEMCFLLEEEINGGDEKKAQLKEWERYFNYTKDGHKFIIVEIYAEPKKKEVRKGNNSIYVEYIELLLMNYLAKRDKNNTLFSTIELLKGLSFANSKYFACRDAISSYNTNDACNDINVDGNDYEDNDNWLDDLDLEENLYESSKSKEEETLNTETDITEIFLEDINKDNSVCVDEYDLNNFFARTHLKFQRILESALKSLRNRCLIDLEERTFIVMRKNGKDFHYPATEEQRSLILDAERFVLNDMGLVKKNSVYLSFKTGIFYRKVKKYINENYGWEYYYKKHSIVWLTDEIKKTIPRVEIELSEKLLNKKVIMAVDTEATNKYVNSENKIKTGHKEALNARNEKDREDRMIKMSGKNGDTSELVEFAMDIDDWMYTLDDYVKQNKIFRYKPNYVETQKCLSSYFLTID